MSSLTQAYIVLVTAGMLLVILEIFVPGGILGIVGGLALMAAIGCGFVEFPHPWGLISAIAILFVSGVTLAVWVRFVPQSPIGRKIALAGDGRLFKASESHASLIGKEGVALTILRPAGIAKIEGARVDVVAESSFVASGAKVRVVAAEGNRVIVREIHPA